MVSGGRGIPETTHSHISGPNGAFMAAHLEAGGLPCYYQIEIPGIWARCEIAAPKRSTLPTLPGAASFGPQLRRRAAFQIPVCVNENENDFE